MTDFIHGAAVGDAHITEVFDEFPEMAREELVEETRELTGDLKSAFIADIEAVTKVHSGKLRSSVRSEVYDDPESVKGMVYSTDGAIAVALEYGAHGTGKVNPYRKHLTHLWGTPISTIVVDVPAYLRTQDVAPHSFARPALKGLETTIIDGYQAALDRATEKAQEALDGNAV